MVSYIALKRECFQHRKCAISSVDRVPGYEPVGRRFESCVARHETFKRNLGGFLLLFFRKCVIILKKLDKTRKKYPVEKAKGVSTKYNKL